MGFYYHVFLPCGYECSYQRMNDEDIKVVVVVDHPLKNVEDEDEEHLQRGCLKAWKREKCGSKCEHSVKMWVKWVYIKNFF